MFRMQIQMVSLNAVLLVLMDHGRKFSLSALICLTFVCTRPPPIEVNTSDSLLVHVTNSIDKPATLHHHGMFFNSTSWMDGAMSVSQWYVHFQHEAFLLIFFSHAAVFPQDRHSTTSYP